MKVILNLGKETEVKDLSFDEWRLFMAEYLRYNPYASHAWDVMTGLRGPDSPSERPDMSPDEHSKSYKGRRTRKYNTVEVIREAAFFGSMGGGARHHKDNKVIVPSYEKRDHFDRHVVRAANALGLQVKVEEKEP